MRQEQNHSLIVVQGLGDDDPDIRKSHRKAAGRLAAYGFDVTHHRFGWHDGGDFVDKLSMLDDVVEKKLEVGREVSLLGSSMGGSVVIAELMEHPEDIAGVVTVASPLQNKSVPSYITPFELALNSPLTVEALGWLEEHTDTSLSPQTRDKVLNITVNGDTMVHHSMSTLPGMKHLHLLEPARNHVHAVRRTLQSGGGIIADFLKK